LAFCLINKIKEKKKKKEKKKGANPCIFFSPIIVLVVESPTNGGHTSQGYLILQWEMGMRCVT
jgi:hypothetical protein